MMSSIVLLIDPLAFLFVGLNVWCFLGGFVSDGGRGGVGGMLLRVWVPFGPCFAWIFLGAPFVEKLHAAPRLKGALGAVTAAVVGVIASLALWFGLRVIFRDVQSLSLGPVRLDLPVLTSLDPAALALAVFAAVLLFAMKQGLVRTLGFTALAGLGLKFGGFGEVSSLCVKATCTAGGTPPPTLDQPPAT